MVTIYLDAASLADIEKYGHLVEGITTNPSLMKKEGITDYHHFGKAVVALAAGKPVSFEVLSEDPREASDQARQIAAWGPNIFVKVPIINTQGQVQADLISDLSYGGLKLNVTAILTREHARAAAEALEGGGHILSVFAGRISDAGYSPLPTMNYARSKCRMDTKLLWASTREIYNVVQAENCADIITLAPALLDKLPKLEGDLNAVALDTVKQFYNDAKGITL